MLIVSSRMRGRLCRHAEWLRIPTPMTETLLTFCPRAGLVADLALQPSMSFQGASRSAR
jgi:hypothetical protein